MRILLVVCLFLSLASCGDQSGRETSVIEGVTIIDAVNGVRENHTVVFIDDEIIQIFPTDESPDFPNAIDGSGQYLIPGLWDFHVHLTYDVRLTAAMPELFLSWGITSVRDTGGLMRNILPVVDSMNKEGAVSPRVYFAGPLLDGNLVVYNGVGRPEIGVSVRTPEEARQAVRELYDDGISFIKIYELTSPEVFSALIDVADELGLPVDSHVPLSMRASVAGAQVDSIEHLRNIELDCAANADELLIARIRQLENPDGLSGADLRASLHNSQRLPAIRNYNERQCNQTIDALSATMMVPTLRLNSIALNPPYEKDDWEDALSRLPASVRAQWFIEGERRKTTELGDLTFAEWSLSLTKQMHESGVPFGAGTDVPINLSIPGYSLHSELEMLVMAGLAPIDALAAATIKPAQYFSLEEEMGSIDIGKRADMVLLEANPLDDIRNTKRINLVISKGRILEF